MATDIYAIPDLTKKVRKRDGHRGQRGEATEDSVQLEERGEREDRVVDIYESVDGILSGPQDDMRDNTAGTHTQGQSSKTVSPLKVVAVCLGMLCLILLGGIIGQAVQHHSDNNQTNCNNLTLEKELLDTKFNHLTTKYYNLTQEKKQLDTKFNHLTQEKYKLQSEVNQLKRETAVKPCPCGWKFGSSCYYGSAERKTWDESRAECQKTGADLVIINSPEELGFIKGLISIGNTWIGLKRTAGEWTWVDGTPLKTRYWSNGYPYYYYGHLEKCAYSLSSVWYNEKCSEKRAWICEKIYSS